MNFIFWNTPDDITEDELDRSADTAEQNKAATMDEVARPQEANQSSMVSSLWQHYQVKQKQNVTILSSRRKTTCNAFEIILTQKTKFFLYTVQYL